MSILKHGRQADIAAFLKDLDESLKDAQIPVITLMGVQGNTPFKVLFATILTARTKDTTTIPVVKRLFSVVKNAQDIVQLDVSEIEKLIFPVGFYKTKARNMKKTAQYLIDAYGGEVPGNFDDLVKLPGVGPKTANLVLSEAFAQPTITVDVHVHRISNRLGYIKTQEPEQTQKDLEKLIPVELWRIWNPSLVAHGQTVCTPISPKCSMCAVKKYCKRVGVTQSR